MGFITIYITHESMEEAEKICGALLEEKLAACANYFPIKSSYWWKGKIEEGEEVVSLVKARSENWEAIKRKVEEIHPYEVPCVIKFEAEANKEYEDWVKKNSSG